jgi:hypothetical protein
VPRANTVVRFLFSLLRTRVAWAVLWIVLAFWLFDRLVYFATETQWFASLGLQAMWWGRCRAQAELFLGFAFLALLLTRLFLTPVSRIGPTAIPLRGKLAGFELLRGRAPRFFWNLAVLVSLFYASRFTRHWPDWLLLRGGSPSDSTYLGLPTALWTQWLPIVTPLLHVLWSFSLLLFLAVAITGVLRALPELAARRPAPPLALTRILWILGGWLLLLRAAMHAVGLLNLARGRALESGDVFVTAPLLALGSVCCVLLAFVALRRTASATSRRKFSMLAAPMLAAVWLPGILNWFAAPARALLPETNWLRQARQSATVAAWQLDFASPGATPAGVVPENVWPIWEEKVLLKPPGFSNRIFVTWKNVTIARSGGKWNAIAAGQGAGATAWNANRETGDSTQLILERFDLGSSSGETTGIPLPGIEAYFGLEGGSLFTNDNFGVSIASIARKWLWAWRLRDLFLVFEGADVSRLLVFRGAQERAEKIAPFWKVGDSPQLVLSGSQPYWLLDVCAATSNFPGAMPAPQGELAGQNAASDSIKMLLDARTGAVSFFALAPRKTDPLQATWRAALPGVLRNPDQMPVALQQQWRAAPAMLSAQLLLSNEVRSERARFDESRIFAPQPGTGEDGRTLTRVLSLHKDAFESLEAMQGLQPKRILRRGDSDLTARLAAIDAALDKVPEGRSMVAGQPSVWPDANMPGGFGIGRAFFLLPQQKTPPAKADSGLELWRVAITGSAAGARVGMRDSASAASLDMMELLPGQVAVKSGQKLSPAVQALRAHDAAQAAFKRGDWLAYGRETQRERKILEQMAAQSAVN